MKGNEIFKLTLGLAVSGVLISCGVAPTAIPTSVPTAEPVLPTEGLSTATLAPTTVEPSQTPSPAETATETEQPTGTLVIPTAAPAASPHFKNGEKLRLDYIHMVSTTDGWGISGRYVLTTADGGKSWREVTPPEPIQAGAKARAFGVFPDRQRAWILYGVNSPDSPYPSYQIDPEASVWTTNDGGQTWRPSAPLSHDVNAEDMWAEFAALNGSNGWMLLRGVYVGAGTHYVADFFQTSDGSATWNLIQGDFNWDYTGIVFTDQKNGWLTWQTTGAYAPAPPAYAVTGDGGLNWDFRELPPPNDQPDLFDKYDYCEPYQPNLLSVESVRLLVACFDFYSPPHHHVSYLYSSEDAGQNWTIDPLPAKVNASNDTLIFFDKQNSLLLGRDMYQSDDGGRTWSLIKTVNWDGQFSFVDDQNGWAIATNDNHEAALVQTTNGGKNWSQINPVATR